MEEITLKDLQGLWLGEEFNLFIGNHRNPNYGNLVNKLDGINVETRNLELSEVTLGNTRMLIFNENYSIEIWGWYITEITITVNNIRYNLTLRT